MPLPFLKFRKEAGIRTSMRASDFNKSEDSESDKDQALIAVSGELLIALNNKNTQAVADALRAAFEILESEPHAEGEHTNEQPYSQE